MNRNSGFIYVVSFIYFFTVFYYILIVECLINNEIFKIFHMGVVCLKCERGRCLSLMTVRQSAQVSCLNLGVSRAVWNFFGPCVWLGKYFMLHVLPDVTFPFFWAPVTCGPSRPPLTPLTWTSRKGNSWVYLYPHFLIFFFLFFKCFDCDF